MSFKEFEQECLSNLGTLLPLAFSVFPMLPAVLHKDAIVMIGLQQDREAVASFHMDSKTHIGNYLCTATTFSKL